MYIKSGRQININKCTRFGGMHIHNMQQPKSTKIKEIKHYNMKIRNTAKEHGHCENTNLGKFQNY